MDALAAILQSEDKRQRLLRAGPGTCASLATEAVASGRTAVLVACDRSSFSELYGLARLFSPDISQGDWPRERPFWERSVLSFPAWRFGESPDVWAGRMAAFYGLARQAPRCIVAAVSSLCLRYMPLDFFQNRSLDLAPGQDCSPELILEQASEWGYVRCPMVMQPGEMARRGDILDIFAPGYTRPIRLEFFGDTIEEIRLFDADSQRSLQALTELTLIPASPLPGAEGERRTAAMHIDQLRQEGRLTENEAYSLKKRLEQGGRDILPGIVWPNASYLHQWLPDNSIFILPGEINSLDSLRERRASLKEAVESGDGDVQQPADIVLRRDNQPVPWNSFSCVFAEPLVIGVEARGINLPERAIHSFNELFPRQESRDRPWQAIANGLKTWPQEYARVVLSFASERKRQKFLKLAEQDGILPLLRYAPDQEGTFALVSSFDSGLDLEWDRTLVLGEDILYPKADKRQRKAAAAFRGLDNFSDLRPGDLLVHRDYGIGRYMGLESLVVDHVSNDFLLLEYSGQDKLYVPVDRLGLVQKFKAQEGLEPNLDRLGTHAWATGKEKARKAIEKIAADLVQMYAYRKVAKSFTYGPPDDLYREFEATFAFEETPDQAQAIQDVLDDMERPAPMDRLVCGDVGFGKTEVAMRAAFRAASEGRQVALLCPTTVLAEQHYQTFRSRLTGFPVNVGLLSRFVPRAQQKETLKACEQGQIDILVGTHRLLSNDVKLPNLALLILDEEQRFGVRHKEKLKAMKQNVDVLTLTATPIPRTLQLSMSGIRDLSIIETAPVDRKPVATAILPRDADTLRQAVERELAREGQVFWVYNRVHNLEQVVSYVKSLVPNARVGVAHGQMAEGELEDTMRKFWHGELDVLVSTSIIESGLDFPRANTLIVDQAQMFGLGQLYQLRGRVGRSDRQAYACLVVPNPQKLTDVAEERLRVILSMDYLGAGFQVAMEDLRLRGAGNILGEAQSGHMARVGLDLYLEMLEQEVSRLKGEPLPPAEAELNIHLPAHIPDSYIEDARERLRCYKALTSAADGAAREETLLGIRDRFGPLPLELLNFQAVLDFKQLLGKLQVERADIHPDNVRLIWRQGQNTIAPEKILALRETHPDITVTPPAALALPLATDMPFADALRQGQSLLETIVAQ